VLYLKDEKIIWQMEQLTVLIPCDLYDFSLVFMCVVWVGDLQLVSERYHIKSFESEKNKNFSSFLK
jgi:hypothetical protein